MAKKAQKNAATEVAPANGTTPAAEKNITETKDAPAGKHRRASSSAGSDVHLLKPEELKEYLGDDKDLKIAKEVSRLNWKMNTSPASLDEASQLKTMPISDPKVKKMTIFFSTGLHVTARASSTTSGKQLGVTVMDVLNAIHKQMKKKADDELELPVLGDLEWGRGDTLKEAAGSEWPAVVLVQQKKEQAQTSKKKK